MKETINQINSHPAERYQNEFTETTTGGEKETMQPPQQRMARNPLSSMGKIFQPEWTSQGRIIKNILQDKDIMEVIVRSILGDKPPT